MDLEQELEQARRHVAEGEAHLRQQHSIVEELERNGHDASQARTLLATMEESQQLHREGLARLVDEQPRPTRA